jgi:hypothetical protein
MQPRLCGLVSVAALSVPLLTAGAVSAQEYDRARFRGGINLEGGALIVPQVAAFGLAGLQGVLGAQINNNWGVYATPSLDFPFGKVFGIGVGAGVMADYTFTGLPLGVALGPEFGVVGAIGTCAAGSANCNSVAGFGGAFYGARARVAYYPIIAREGWRRRALAIGLDLRFLTGAFGAASTTTVGGNTTTSASVNQFGFSPMVSIGYAAF